MVPSWFVLPGQFGVERLAGAVELRFESLEQVRCSPKFPGAPDLLKLGARRGHAHRPHVARAASEGVRDALDGAGVAAFDGIDS